MHHTIVVVPCYNEERRFRRGEFPAYLADHPGTRFLLVDDGSTDGTLAVLEATAADSPDRIGVLALRPNGGKAEAVRRGMLRALEDTPRYVGFWDADLATPLDAIAPFVELLDSRPEVAMVFGARVKLLGRRVERSAVRHYLGRVFATAASLTLGIPIYDTQCGAKLFRASEDLAACLADPFVARWVFDVELIARALARARARADGGLDSLIVEFPLLEWHDVKGSKVKPIDFLKAGYELARIAARYR